MIIGTVKQQGLMLYTEIKHVANQYSGNLRISVEFTDKKFDGYSLLWLYAHDTDMLKTSVCDYDISKKEIILPENAFSKNGYLYISLRGIKGDEKITSTPVAFYIDISGNPKATNTPKEHGWEDVARDLFEQINENEYRKPMQELITSTNEKIKRIIDKADGDYDTIKKDIDLVIANYKKDYNKFISDTTSKYELDRQSMVKDVSETLKKFNDEAQVAMDVVEDINKRLTNDEFRGQQGIQGIQGKTGSQGIQGPAGLTGANGIQGIQGIQGIKGDKGDIGAQGLSGVSVPSSGMFALVGDGVTGDLYVEYPDSTHPPTFDVTAYNDIYFVI